MVCSISLNALPSKTLMLIDGRLSTANQDLLKMLHRELRSLPFKTVLKNRLFVAFCLNNFTSCDRLFLYFKKIMMQSLYLKRVGMLCFPTFEWNGRVPGRCHDVLVKFSVWIFAGLMIEWVMVRGYDEAHRRQDAPGSRNQAPSTPGDLSCPDVWTESRYQVFRRITDNSNAAMLNFHVSSTTIGFT